MSTPPRGADLLVQALQRAGTRCIFTLSGNHVLPVYDALLGSGIRLIHTRHEAAAVHMADAWGRLTGDAGIALVTGGPGHANALSALYTARMSESPLVLLSGQAPQAQRGMGAFQELPQAEMAVAVTKASWAGTAADGLGVDLARAIRTARSGRAGPVHLSLPVDLLEAPVGLPQAQSAAEALDFNASPMPLANDDARTLLGLLLQARRPLVLTGPAGLTPAGRELAAALEAACGVPVIGMESPRGIADPSLGAFADVLAQCDTVLLLGKRLDFTLAFGKVPAVQADAQWLQVDAEAAEFERTRRIVGARLRATAQADTGAALAALEQIATGRVPRHAAWCAEVRDAIAYRPATWVQALGPTSARPLPGEAGKLYPLQALAPLQALLDSHPDAVLIADGGEIGQWAQACLRAPHRLINGPAGAIGAALPFALAARCALPEAPIVTVMGDGAFGFHLAEMDTALRCGLPLVAVIGNDARWNAEHQLQLRHYGAERLIGCELLPTRYDQVTAAFGGHGEYVSRSDELLPALRRALASGLPACVNVMIDGLPAPQLRLPATAQPEQSKELS